LQVAPAAARSTVSCCSGCQCLVVAVVTECTLSLSLCRELKQIFLDGNEIRHIPNTFADLTKLKMLRLDANRIEIVNPVVGFLCSLRKLWLALTDITMLPPELSYCTNLIDLQVRLRCRFFVRFASLSSNVSFSPAGARHAAEVAAQGGRGDGHEAHHVVPHEPPGKRNPDCAVTHGGILIVQ